MLDQKIAQKASKFLFLIILWLAAYKLADQLSVLPPHLSLWFLPAGVTLSIMIAAPGWQKLAPIVANLLLAAPWVDAVFGLHGANFYDQFFHAARHSAVYFVAALAIARFAPQLWDHASLANTSIFISIVGIAASAAAIMGVSLHALSGNFSWEVAADVVIHWAIGDAVAALVLPPILVPLILFIFGRPWSASQLPRATVWAQEFASILFVMALASFAIWLNPNLGSLWYLSLIPPIFAGVRHGTTGASVSVFLTTMITPLVARLVGFQGEGLALSILLTIACIASYLVGTAVSVQRETLTALDAHNRDLEEAIKERTAELKDAYEFQRHLIRSLGHDMRQPIQTIAMLTAGMAAQKQYNEPIVDAITQINGNMGNFLDGVLNYAQTDPGAVQPSYSSVTVDELFRNLEIVYRPIADKRGVQLIVQTSPTELWSDPVLLRQALSNDLDNAIRLSAVGGIVTLHHEKRDGQHALMVRDQIAIEYAHPPGTAGFGYGIVARVCSILGAVRIKQTNVRGLLIASA